MPRMLVTSPSRRSRLTATTIPATTQVGAVVWLKPTYATETAAPDVPFEAFDHPCIIVDSDPGSERFTICIVTSLSGTPAGQRNTQAERRGGHVPILPNAYLESPPAVFVELKNFVKLRRNSWVIVNRAYTVPIEVLSTFDSNHSANHFLLTAVSIANLRLWCGLQAQVDRHLFTDPIARNLSVTSCSPEVIDAVSSSSPPPPAYSNGDGTPDGILNIPEGHVTSRPPVVVRPAPASWSEQPPEYTEVERMLLLQRHRIPSYPDDRYYATFGQLQIVGQTHPGNDSAHPHSSWGNAHCNNNEEAGTFRRRACSRGLHPLRRAVLAVWLHLPSGQTIGKCLLWAFCISVVAGTLGMLGYCAYLVIHNILVVIMAGWSAIARVGSILAIAVATAWRAIGNGLHSVEAALSAFGNIVGNGLRGMANIAVKVVATVKALLGRI